MDKEIVNLSIKNSIFSYQRAVKRGSWYRFENQWKLSVSILLFLICTGTTYADSCKDVVKQLESQVSASYAAWKADYAYCISLYEARRWCGKHNIRPQVKTDGMSAWINTDYCHPLEHQGGACFQSSSSPIQCDTVKDNQSRTCPIAGDPIVVATGNSFQTQYDYKSNKPFGLNFVRYYNSSSIEVATDIGIKWRHNFSQNISSVSTSAFVYRNNGHTYIFNFNGEKWISDADVPDTLVEIVDASGMRTGWLYTDSSNTEETYNATGQLLNITNTGGNSLTLIYNLDLLNGGDDDAYTLDKVTSSNGETLLFSHDAAKRIISMTDPENNIYTYTYDDLSGNLVSVIYPDQTPLDNTDNLARIYHYENTAFSHHLTGLTDEAGNRVIWGFDINGRAISSELGGGLDKSALVFNVDGTVTVTNPLDKQTTYHFETIHGVRKVTQVEGHQSANCAAANQSYTYDANGFKDLVTEWEGNITDYDHDARGLEVQRIEAKGTPQERTITTEWHPDFRLPTKITEPDRVIDFSYDTQGLLLERKETPVP